MVKGPLYEYQGEMLTQADIAKKTGINRATLADWYKRTQDMNLAVEGAKKSLALRNMPYYDEVLSMKAIAKKEGIKEDTLRKYYEQSNDIYEAVKRCKDNIIQRQERKLMYKGKITTKTKIAEEEDLDIKSLLLNYKQTNDIEEAVRLTKEARDKHRGTIEYKGQIMSITAIAKLEGIKHERLKELYDLYGNIEKAVMITKQGQLKRKEALLKNKKTTLEDAARELDVSVIGLNKMIESGKSLDDIKKKKKGITADQVMKYDEDSLYRYCLDNSYNYWVIHHLIKTYGKTPEEAVKEYVENGQHFPINWIYEKYGLLFHHLALSLGLDSNRIIKIMKENNYSIEEAITRYVFISNNEKSNFKPIEIEWMKELYEFTKDLKPSEYKNAKETFFITDEEEDFIKDKGEKIEKINRQLLLFEFSRVLEEWPTNELLELMDLYDITPQEKLNIVLDLYAPFSNKMVNPIKESKERHYALSCVITNPRVTTEFIMNNKNLLEEEKQEILRKRELLGKIFPPAIPIKEEQVSKK